MVWVWLGLLFGAAIGSLGGFPGILLGALIGVAAGSLLRKALATAPSASQQQGREAGLLQRMTQLEQRLVAVETALARAGLGTRGESESDRAGAVEPGRAPSGVVAQAVAPDTAAETVGTAAPTQPPPSTRIPVRKGGAGAGALAATPPPRTAPPTATPNRVWAWFSGGNTLVRVGLLVLFLGVAFLLKYAADRGRLPIELRLAAVALGAIMLSGIGWRLRERRRAYALALQGGGVGVLYLTVFAALRIYALLPPIAALVLLLAIVFCSAALALLQDSVGLAAVGAIGGFLAPLLIATGAGNHVLLFSYYALLNAGVLGIAWFRAWRVLNLLGLVFTALVGSLWGLDAYRPELRMTTEPFVALFFVCYVAIAVLYAWRRSLAVQSVVDGTVVFATPLVAFGWQAGLFRDERYALAASAVLVAAIYLALARALLARRDQKLLLLVQSFVALGVVFATLAIPLALDAQWTSAAWALEGAAIVWVGLKQQRVLARGFGMLLQPAAGLAFVYGYHRAFDALPVINVHALGCLFVALGGLSIAWLVDRRHSEVRRWERVARALFFLWGLGWWLFGGVREITEFVPAAFRGHAQLAFVAATAIVFSEIARRGAWALARLPAYALAALLTLAAGAEWIDNVHPAANGGWIAWPFALIAQYALLKRHEENYPALIEINHCLTLWVAVALIAWESAWNVGEIVGAGAWDVAAWGAIPALVLSLLPRSVKRIAWPVARWRRAYLGIAAGGFVIYLALWTLYANNASDGSAAPLPYLPLANPLDLAIAFALLAIVVWMTSDYGRELGMRQPDFARFAPMLFGGLAFVWLTAILLRTMHHWTGVAYRFDAMARSMPVQSALSVFWAALALATMIYAVRRVWRGLWIVGSVLLAVVVMKLFLVDLSNIGGVERIVSFIGVGVLLLVIGYFAPVPPRGASEARETPT